MILEIVAFLETPSPKPKSNLKAYFVDKALKTAHSLEGILLGGVEPKLEAEVLSLCEDSIAVWHEFVPLNYISQSCRSAPEFWLCPRSRQIQQAR